jgi:hypothetical protein
MKQIAWITSYPKSGNTWMRTILAKALFNNNDINMLTNLVPSFNHLLQKKFGNSRTVSVDKVLAGWDELQSFIAKQNMDNKVILKTHNVSGILDKTNFPNEHFTYKAIYLVRDPRDVLLSWAEHRGKTLEQTQKDMFNPQFNLINKHKSSYSTEFLSSWDNHVNGWLRSNTETLFVKYEDLLDQTGEYITKILDFLKIEPVCSLDEIVDSTRFDVLKAQENTAGFREKAQGESFFRKGVKNAWRDIDWDFSDIEKKFAPVMEQFGYQ